MTLTFKSSIPETFTLTGKDTDGRERKVVATKRAQDFNWNLRLQHPSGESWSATYHAPGGAGILDAMTELLRSKDADYKQDRARGDKPRQAPFDPNRSVDSDMPAIKSYAWKTY